MRKRIILFLSVIFVLLSSISCTRVAVALTNKKDPFKKKTVWVKGDKEIIYIPMIHVAKVGYYEKVKDFLSQKRNEGYVVYYEGLENGGKTPEERDTLILKVRKILGFNICGGYSDKKNQSTPQYLKKYVGQNHTNTGIDPKRDVRADLTFKEIIAKIEAESGKIELEPCDFETPLNAPYECTNYRRQYDYSFKRSFRDKYLNQLLLNSTDKKIVVLYGQSHTWAVYPTLDKEGFRLVEGKWLGREKKKFDEESTTTH